MEKELTNIASVLGEYNSVPVSITSQALVVTMLDGLTITKSADKMVWADGVLTFTLLVDNKTSETYSSVVITDTLDTSLVSFVSGSVTVGGTKYDESKYTFDTTTGVLTINLDDIAPSGSTTITFQVTKTS